MVPGNGDLPTRTKRSDDPVLRSILVAAPGRAASFVTTETRRSPAADRRSTDPLPGGRGFESFARYHFRCDRCLLEAQVCNGRQSGNNDVTTRPTADRLTRLRHWDPRTEEVVQLVEVI